MVDHTNVNDAAFLGDWVLNEDYMRDLNSHETAIRDLAYELWKGFATINVGLTVENGTAANTFKVRYGYARDETRYPVIVPADVDNIPNIDMAGGWNYIAVRHVWTYANADAAVKTGAAYNRVRADSYEIDVDGLVHNEAAGWVNLARAQLTGGIWVYEMFDPWRSRSGNLALLQWNFTYTGVVPGIATMMNHQGVNWEQFVSPVYCDIKRVTIMARIVGADDATATVRVGGIATPITVTLAAGNLGPTVYYYPPGAACPANVTVHAEVIAAGAAGPTDVTLNITGEIVSGLS